MVDFDNFMLEIVLKLKTLYSLVSAWSRGDPDSIQSVLFSCENTRKP